MGSLTDTWENAALDAILGSGHAANWPATVYVCLFTADPTEAGSFDDEATGGSYGRVAVTNDSTNWPNAAGSQKSNGAAVTFPEATGAWGTCTFWGLADHATNADPANLIGSAALSSAVSPLTGDTPEFDVGTLVLNAN